MPSIRRSFSSLSVRSSPYTSSAIPSSARARATALHPRRSAASATAERRVLADIEWWRVYDGQCDLDLQDQAHEDVHGPPDADVSPGGMVTLSAGGGSLEPQTPLHPFSLDSTQSVTPDALATLSIAPYSPLGRDSGESTPELPTTPLETVQPGLASPASCPFGDHISFPSSLTRVGGRPVHPLFGLRSISAPGLSYHLQPDFADMGGDSFSLDQNLFQQSS